MAVFTKDGMVHSQQYHRHFEDYMEIVRMDENGKRRIERVYVGQYYSLDAQPKKTTQLKLSYVLLYIAALFFFFLGNSITCLSGLNKLVQLPVFAGTILLLYYGIVILRYVTRPKEMTVWEYKSGPLRILSIGKCFVAAVALKVIATMIFMLFVRGWTLKTELISILGCAVSALPVAVIIAVEKKQHYNTRVSEAQMPRGGHYID